MFNDTNVTSPLNGAEGYLRVNNNTVAVMLPTVALLSKSSASNVSTGMCY